MATSNDHPGLRFVQAKGYTRGRPDGPPLWIVWHDMEVDELPGRAESTARYFANPSDGREVSSHFCVDSNSVIQTVDEDDTAWTVGNRPGNNRGINIELAGRASQTAAQWLDPYSRAMFDVIAPVVARSMTRWHIPNRWCTLADLDAYRPGHTTHNDLRRAFGVTTHTDPGPGFPFDHVTRVIAAALGQEGDTDMPLSDEDLTKVRAATVGGVVDAFKLAAARGAPDASPTSRQFDDALKTVIGRALPGLLRSDVDGSYVIWRVEALTHLRDPIAIHRPDGTTVEEANVLAQLLRGLEAKVAANAAADATRDAASATAINALAAAIAAGGGSVDSAAIIAAVRAEGETTRRETETTRQLVAQLRLDNADLQRRLAAALTSPTATVAEGDG